MASLSRLRPWKNPRREGMIRLKIISMTVMTRISSTSVKAARPMPLLLERPIAIDGAVGSGGVKIVAGWIMAARTLIDVGVAPRIHLDVFVHVRSVPAQSVTGF